MDIFLVALVSAAASLITLFSGFGLGTMLTPVFVLFFPIETAIALTGIVHFFNNIFKMGLLWKQAQWKIVLRFGIPSIIGAFVGAQLLLMLIHIDALTHYSLLGKMIAVEPVKVIIAVLMMYFGFAEAFPRFQKFRPSKQSLPAGGLLSGFFGGLSGHQGALRTVFLLRYELTKEQFIATGVVVACLVDVTRLTLYTSHFLTAAIINNAGIISSATVCAFLGAYIGKKILPKVEYSSVRRIVAVFLMLIALGLGSGIL